MFIEMELAWVMITLDGLFLGFVEVFLLFFCNFT